MADGRKIIPTTSIVSFIIRYGMDPGWATHSAIPPSGQIGRGLD